MGLFERFWEDRKEKRNQTRINKEALDEYKKAIQRGVYPEYIGRPSFITDRGSNSLEIRQLWARTDSNSCTERRWLIWAENGGVHVNGPTIQQTDCHDW